MPGSKIRTISIIILIFLISNIVITSSYSDSDIDIRVIVPFGRDSFNGYSNHVELERPNYHYFRVDMYLYHNGSIIQFDFMVIDDDYYKGDNVRISVDTSDGREPQDDYILGGRVNRDGGMNLVDETYTWATVDGGSGGFNVTFCIDADYYDLSNGSLVVFYIAYVDYYDDYQVCHGGQTSSKYAYIIDESSYDQPTTTTPTQPIPGFVFPFTIVILIIAICFRISYFEKKDGDKYSIF